MSSNVIMTNIFAPTPMRPGRLMPVLSPVGQVLPEDINDLKNIYLQSLENLAFGQDLLVETQRTLQLAANVKSDTIQVVEELKEQGFEEQTDIIMLLYKDVPTFSFYIQAIPEIKRIMFKRRQLR